MDFWEVFDFWDFLGLDRRTNRRGEPRRGTSRKAGGPDRMTNHSGQPRRGASRKAGGPARETNGTSEVRTNKVSFNQGRYENVTSSYY